MTTESIHLLLLAVVQAQDVDAATRALESLDASVVYMASTGGFLGRRNATLMIGLPDGLEEQALSALRSVCRQRVEYMTMPLEGSPMPMRAPVPVTVGGATVLAVPVERFEQF